MATPLSTQPQVTPETEWFLQTFGRLAATRRFNDFGPLPLSFSDYKPYFEIFTPIYELCFTIDILIGMDFALLNHFAEQQKSKRK